MKMDMNFDFAKIKEILQVSLQDKNLFVTAFTHRSYLNEHPEYKGLSNERLEFLGDAVLQLLSSQHLYDAYPEQPEGVLTNYRSSIVCTPSIAEEAKRLGYGEFLFLSNGEEATGGREREYILANTFEAVLGALFLDQNLEVCRTFIERELLYKVPNIIDNEEYKDAKSKFQELAQERKGITPTYKVLDAHGPDHEKTFVVGVFLSDEKFGEGQGRSKQKAEQQAAVAALKKLGKA
jgi:ribonuclease III